MKDDAKTKGVPDRANSPQQLDGVQYVERTISSREPLPLNTSRIHMTTDGNYQVKAVCTHNIQSLPIESARVCLLQSLSPD